MVVKTYRGPICRVLPLPTSACGYLEATCPSLSVGQMLSYRGCGYIVRLHYAADVC